jgi:hypothetical protein
MAGEKMTHIGVGLECWGINGNVSSKRAFTETSEAKAFETPIALNLKGGYHLIFGSGDA